MRHLLLALAFFFICLCGAEKCMHPPPSPNYNNELYSGRWYEVGKYQTFGGAIFQRGTVCTIATYAPYNLESGGGDIGYSSRQDEPNGAWVNATGTLTVIGEPGHFSQTLTFGDFEGPAVDYNVIWLDEDTAIEYDCTEHLLGNVDYCVHFMSRKPTIEPAKFDEMMQFVADMELNTHNLEYKVGDQNGCW